MTLATGFHVEPADWASEQDAMRAIRGRVFIDEQQVSVEEEWDGLDPDCRHVLARDDAGVPIGTARLTPDRHIGRMAVLADWRGRGVGAAMLQAMLDLARSLGWDRVSLNAQVHALGFYARHGFVAEGEVFLDAGIEHRAMHMDLAPVEAAPGERGTPVLRPDYEVLEGDTRESTLAAVLRVLADARHAVVIHHRELGYGVLDQEPVLAEIRRLATSGRGADVRILVGDPERLLREGHRMVPLAQRLTTGLRLRAPVEEEDKAYPSAFLVNDVGGYLMLPLVDRYEARGATSNPGISRQLRRYFDEVWERSEPATALRSLGL